MGAWTDSLLLLLLLPLLLLLLIHLFASCFILGCIEDDFLAKQAPARQLFLILLKFENMIEIRL